MSNPEGQRKLDQDSFWGGWGKQAGLEQGQTMRRARSTGVSQGVFTALAQCEPTPHPP